MWVSMAINCLPGMERKTGWLPKDGSRILSGRRGLLWRTDSHPPAPSLGNLQTLFWGEAGKGRAVSCGVEKPSEVGCLWGGVGFRACEFQV